MGVVHAPTTKAVGSELVIKKEPTALVVGLQKNKLSDCKKISCLTAKK
jgi:hypothetical protein